MNIKKILHIAVALLFATGIQAQKIDDNCYNTLGQRVSKNAKGLIIYKGKVYLNR